MTQIKTVNTEKYTVKTILVLFTFISLMIVAENAYSANDNAINFILKKYVLKNNQSKATQKPINNSRQYASEFVPDNPLTQNKEYKRKIAKEKLKYLFFFGKGVIEKNINRKNNHNSAHKKIKQIRANILDLTENMKKTKEDNKSDKIKKDNNKNFADKKYKYQMNDQNYKKTGETEDDFLNKLKTIDNVGIIESTEKAKVEVSNETSKEKIMKELKPLSVLETNTVERIPTNKKPEHIKIDKKEEKIEMPKKENFQYVDEDDFENDPEISNVLIDQLKSGKINEPKHVKKPSPSRDLGSRESKKLLLDKMFEEYKRSD